MLALLALPLLASSTARAGDFMDVWVSTALEDTNVFAGPEAESPSANFVTRGNSTFFENYESRTTGDISRAQLVLYKKDDSFFKNWWTEGAFVLRYTPYLNPSNTDPGTNIEDDGSYVRIVRTLPGEHHDLSITGYAVDSDRFRLGYSYDLSWGGREIFAFTAGAAPGIRVQYQNHGSYAFVGAKTAIGDFRDEATNDFRNQTYYGMLSGAGVQIADRLKLEAAFGSFQQGQFLNVDNTDSQLYGNMIVAMGMAGQIAFRSRTDLDFIQSADLRLYRNEPDNVRDSYTSHPQIDGVGIIVQTEVDRLSHNLLNATDPNSTVIENGYAGDLQTLVVAGTANFGADLVYKDLAYIVFNVPGLTSNFAMNPTMERTPQLYGRLHGEYYIEKAHLTPALGVGLMQPATYTVEGNTYVQQTDRSKEAVPDGQAPAAILSGIAGVQLDLSKSVVTSGEILYTVNNNLSNYVTDPTTGEGVREPAPADQRNALGFNLIMRARF